jgi:hypothetical protein
MKKKKISWAFWIILVLGIVGVVLSIFLKAFTLGVIAAIVSLIVLRHLYHRKEITRETSSDNKIKNVDLEGVEKTRCLIKFGYDVAIQPGAIPEENFAGLFSDWKRIAERDKDGTVFPGIPETFKELLGKGNEFARKVLITARSFGPLKAEYSPSSYFGSFQVNPVLLAFSATSIMRHFVENPNIRGRRNWYVLNIKPEKNDPEINDLRIVDIQFRRETGKYFLYEYPYSQWSHLCDGWWKLEPEMRFVIPVNQFFLAGNVPVEEKEPIDLTHIIQTT